MADDVSTATPDLLSAAASATQGMIPGHGQGQTPTSMTTFGPAPIVQPPPIPKFQPPQIQMPTPGGSYSSVGERKRANKTALFNGIANMVKSGGDYIQAKKTRDLSMNIQRLMGAQEGIQQAKQALQANPNDPEAKKALEQNASIINDITSDPKKVKQLQKAFNIDLFGDGKNKQENQALVNAWQEYQKKQQGGDKTALNPTAQKFMGQQPITQQLSPEAQAQAAAVKAGLQPNAGELLKAQTEVFKSYQSAQSVDDRSKAMVKAEEIRAKATDARTAALIDNMNKKIFGEQKAAEIRANAQITIANKVSATWDKRIAEIDKVAGMKDVDEQSKTILGTFSKEAQTYNTQMKTLLQDNEKLQAELDKKGTTLFGIKLSAASGADATLIRQKIGYNNLAIQDAQKNLDMVNKKIMNAHGMGLVNLPALAGGSSGDEASGEVNVNDDEVPE